MTSAVEDAGTGPGPNDVAVSKLSTSKTPMPLSPAPAGLSGATTKLLPGHRRPRLFAQPTGSPKTQGSVHLCGWVGLEEQKC